jgi:hypothetical protein
VQATVGSSLLVVTSQLRVHKKENESERQDTLAAVHAGLVSGRFRLVRGRMQLSAMYPVHCPFGIYLTDVVHGILCIADLNSQA